MARPCAQAGGRRLLDPDLRRRDRRASARGLADRPAGSPEQGRRRRRGRSGALRPARCCSGRRSRWSRIRPPRSWLAERLSTFRLTATVAPVDSYDDGVQRVLNRTSDVLFGNRAILLDAARRSASAARADRPRSPVHLRTPGPGVAADDDDFRLVVDRTLSRIFTSKEFTAQYARWFGAPDESALEFFRLIAFREALNFTTESQVAKHAEIRSAQRSRQVADGHGLPSRARPSAVDARQRGRVAVRRRVVGAGGAQGPLRLRAQDGRARRRSARPARPAGQDARGQGGTRLGAGPPDHCQRRGDGDRPGHSPLAQRDAGREARRSI